MNLKTAYVGIDVSKTFHKICVKDDQKLSLIPILEIEDSQGGYEKLRQCLDSLKERHRIDLFSIGIESTGTYHIHLLEWLRKQDDLMVTLINPVQTNHYLKSEMRRASTDKISSEILSQFMVERTPRPTEFLSAEYESVKCLVQHIYALTKQKSATINRLREKVALLWPEFERSFKNFDGKQLLALLTVVQTPEQFLSLEDSLKQVMVLGRRYTLRRNFLRKVRGLSQKAQPRYATFHNEPIIKSLSEQVIFLIQQIERITDELKRTYKRASSEEEPLLATIDGVGEVSAIFFTASIGDPHRFSRTKKISSFFGIAPYVRNSGRSIKGRGYIQKKGNSLVRYYLFNCVLSMIRKKDHPIAQFYRSLLEKGKPKLVAITACMRKLLVIMLAMLKTNTPFNPKLSIAR